MLGIQTNTGKLDMAPESQISLRLISPLFSDEKEDNSHSFPFSVPDSPRNRERLKGISNALIQTPSPSQAAILDFDGAPLYKGEAVVKSVSPRSNIELQFLLEGTANWRRANDTLLRDIDLEGVRNIAAAPGSILSPLCELKLVYGSGAPAVRVRVNDREYSAFWNGGMTDYDVLVDLSNLINAETIIHGVTSSVSGPAPGNNVMTLTPTVSAPHIPFVIDPKPSDPALQYTWTVQNYTSGGEFAQEAMLHHMNLVGSNPTGYDYSFFPVYNPAFFPAEFTDFLEYLNLHEPGTGFVGNSTTAGEHRRTVCVPMPRLKYLIERAAFALGYNIVGDVFTDPDFAEICLYSNQAVEAPDDGAAIQSQGATDFVLWFGASFNLAEQVPQDMTIGDLFRIVKELTNASIVFDDRGRLITLSSKNNIISPPATRRDWRGRNGRYKISLTKDEGYTLQYERDSNDQAWKQHGQQLDDYVVGEGKKKIKSKAAPLLHTNRSNPLSGSRWLIPVIIQEGTSDFYNQSSEPGWRVVFARGMANDEAGNSYPLASWGNTDFAGNTVGNWSMAWDGIAGMAATWWETYLAWRIGRVELETEVLLYHEDIAMIDWYEPVILITEEGWFSGLVTQIDVSLTSRGIAPGRAMVLRL